MLVFRGCGTSLRIFTFTWRERGVHDLAEQLIIPTNLQNPQQGSAILLEPVPTRNPGWKTHQLIEGKVAEIYTFFTGTWFYTNIQKGGWISGFPSERNQTVLPYHLRAQVIWPCYNLPRFICPIFIWKSSIRWGWKTKVTIFWDGKVHQSWTDWKEKGHPTWLKRAPACSNLPSWTKQTRGFQAMNSSFFLDPWRLLHGFLRDFLRDFFPRRRRRMHLTGSRIWHLSKGFRDGDFGEKKNSMISRENLGPRD